MEKQWSYLTNQFLNTTKDTYKKAFIISNYHEAALVAAAAGGDEDFVLLRDRYQPLHTAYLGAYNIWKTAGGAQEGQTLNLNQQFELMVGKIDRWDVSVQVVYSKTTPQYKALFPNGRKPFYTGTIDTRINALLTLGLSLSADVALAAIAAEVTAFYAIIDAARDAQEAGKSTVATGSVNVESARIAIMQMQYADLGFLMNKYYLNPALAAPYFDLTTLREGRQTTFTGTLDPHENEAVLIHTFIDGDEIRLKLTGPVGASFYLGSSPNAIDSTAIVLTANEERTINVADFAVASYTSHRYLTAVNNTVETTHYLVELY